MKNTKRTMQFVIFCLLFIINIALSNTVLAADLAHYHTPQYDENGKLISWHIDADGPFHYIMDIEAKWWLNAPNINGWPAYLTAACLYRNYSQRTNGAVPGTTCSLAILAYLKYYAYTGNSAYLEMARTIGNYVVQQDLTPSTYIAFPNFPWPVGATRDITPDGSGHPNCYAGQVMPDKGAMIGFALLRLYEATGDSRYLNEAIHIANVLADNAAPGNNSQSPWPFRSWANDGTRVDGQISGNQSFALRLYDELIRLGIQGNGKYQATRDNVWNWLKNVAIADASGSKWQDFFEDHSGNEDNPTQICALETGRYLLEKKESLDPDWFNLVGSIINTVKNRWVVHTGSYTAIGEQQQDMTPYNSHTARYASILAMYYEAGATPVYKDEAYSSFCYSAYSVDDDGFADTYYERDIAWTTDSFGDWMLHFMDGLAAVSEWAPNNNSHLLKSSSVIRSISYNPGYIEYITFDNEGSEKLKLNFTPTKVEVNDSTISDWSWDSAAQVLVINRTNGNRVEIYGDETPDTTAPRIVSVNILSETSVRIVFNEPLDSASAQDINNYRVNNGILVTAVSLSYDQLTVTLTTSSHTERSYTLTVSGVKDTSGNTIAPTQLNYLFTQDLVGYWQFDEGTGITAADSSGNVNQATLVNGPIWSQGKIGSALSFDGSNDYLNIPDNPTLRPEQGSLTISIWARPPAQDQIAPLVSKRQNTGDYEQFTLAITGPNSHTWPSGRRVTFLYRESATCERSGYTNRNIADGNWHHIVAVAEQASNTIRIYVDGQEEPITRDYSLGSWPTINNIDSLRIGNANNSNYFSGLIDEVRIYKRALSANEILDLYNNISTPQVFYGDVNADGKISAFDAALAAHIAVALEHPDIKDRAAAEVSGDGEVSAYDAALIAQRAVGLIERFPVEG